VELLSFRWNVLILILIFRAPKIFTSDKVKDEDKKRSPAGAELVWWRELKRFVTFELEYEGKETGELERLIRSVLLATYHFGTMIIVSS
jgi:hypothetical protein